MSIFIKKKSKKEQKRAKKKKNEFFAKIAIFNFFKNLKKSLASPKTTLYVVPRSAKVPYMVSGSVKKLSTMFSTVKCVNYGVFLRV